MTPQRQALRLGREVKPRHLNLDQGDLLKFSSESEDYYYDPFGHYAVHEEALKDDLRMQIWLQVR